MTYTTDTFYDKKEFSTVLTDSRSLDPLMERIGNAKLVLLGEASHGTHEYYTWRTAITKRLIREKNFSFIAVEGDWPDCYRINRYVKSVQQHTSPVDILREFNRWPTWMWANWEVAALMEWLKDHNSGLPYRQRAGFYGLDVYSLWESLEAIMTYLGKEDPATAAAAKKALECFEPFEREGQLYAQLSPLLSRSCKEEVVSMLKEIRLKAREYNGDEEAGFNAEQNALIAVNAERYYRSLMELDDKSWNIRDRHMAETLSRLMAFHGKDARAVVWEHNTHIGDARATDMNRAGIVNLGQLAREQYGEEEVVLVGFASYSGTVIAASAWGAPMQEMSVPEAREGSLEAMLHNENLQDRLLVFNRENPHERFNRDYPHRAIGVVYHPERERYGNYVNSLVSSRYDALIYLDSTKALHPLHIRPVLGPIPETYPFGL